MDAEFLESPFMPGLPVTPDKFKGRTDDINKVIRYMPSVKNGKQNIFLSREREEWEKHHL